MRHPLLRLTLGGGVLGSALMLGCIQGHCPRTPAAPPVAATAHSVEGSTVVPRTQRQEVKILEVLPASSAAAEQEAAEDSPPAVVCGAREDTESAPSPYGHAPNYRWLSGELRYSPARGAWCLRYATGEEQDRHGGSVTLVGAGPMTGFRSGQAVRVEGEMVDPDTHEPSAPYRVRRLRPLPRD